jgi:hypothetical protein
LYVNVTFVLVCSLSTEQVIRGAGIGKEKCQS